MLEFGLRQLLDELTHAGFLQLTSFSVILKCLKHVLINLNILLVLLHGVKERVRQSLFNTNTVNRLLL